MNPITYESGEKKPLLYTTYFFLKNVAISTALGACIGRVLKWYTPSHGAIMGAFSGAIGFAATRISGNQSTQSTAAIARLEEEKGAIYRKHGVSEQEMAQRQINELFGITNPGLNPIQFSQDEQLKLAELKKKSEEATQNLTNIGGLCFFAYLAAPLISKLFQKSTDVRLALRFHLSSSLIGHFAFSKLRRLFFTGMSENGRGVWLENWAEREWLTRAPSDLPPVNAKVRWENFTRVPKTIALDDKVPNSTANQWVTLCNKITWGSRGSPLPTIQKALECIDKEAIKDGTYRYTQNLMAQLYVRLEQEKDPEKQKSNLIFLEEELKKCQSKWLDAIYKTLQNYESAKPTAALQFQENLPNSTLDKWEELCTTVNWEETASPFPEIKEAFEEISQQDLQPITLPVEDGSYRYAANLMAQLYHKLGGEINLEERKRFLKELGNRFESLKALKNGRFTPIHQVLSLYMKERSSQVPSEIEQWALVIDQDIREDLLKNKITSDFEPQLRDVHIYEVVKGALAKESIFTNPGGTDGHVQFEKANPGAKEVIALLNCGTDPFDALRKNVEASKSQWIASLKHRYHAETLFAVFKERLNEVFKQDLNKYSDIILVLGQNARKLLGEDKISLTQAVILIKEELIENKLTEDEDEDMRVSIPVAFKDSAVIFFLQTLGFFEADNEIVPGKSHAELLKTYASKN